MKKIPTLFVRDPTTRLATPEVEPGCEWVLAGEGRATRKWDGTCCMVRGGALYKRVEWDQKKGDAPPEWLHHDFDPAMRHGHGWLPVGIGPEDWMHREAWGHGGLALPDGTYELVGPRIGKNPEGVLDVHLIPHLNPPWVVDGCADVPRDFSGVRAWLESWNVEGVVWHHPDGRMAKIKRVDFGIEWAGKKVKVRP